MSDTFDPTKISPAPWIVGDNNIYWAGNNRHNFVFYHAEDVDSNREDWEFMALARNAFEVMMRRGWTAKRYNGSPPEDGSWYVDIKGSEFAIPCWPDPFTALVEADAWYKEKMEAPPCSE